MIKRTPKMNKRKLLAALRRILKKSGDRVLSFKEFIRKSGFRPSAVRRNFARWSEALEAAGYDTGSIGWKVTTERLLEDWGAVARKAGRVPVAGDYHVLGRFGLATLLNRFGGWLKTREAFRSFAKGKEQWHDVMRMAVTEEGTWAWYLGTINWTIVGYWS